MNKVLSKTEPMYEASEAVALKGDMKAPKLGALGLNHFVALAKTRDGSLWEFEGSRKGLPTRESLKEGADAISEPALELGIERLIDIQRKGNSNLNFSCIALAPSVE